MRKLVFFLFFIVLFNTNAQDTFSIVAVDSITGQVGVAAASCLDLTGTEMPEDIISQLIPNKGAIICQAHYHPLNQSNASRLMKQGKTPNQIIQWLIRNDAEDSINPNSYKLRQYGIASLINKSPKVASYSGPSIDTVYDRIVGSNYTIQGNSLNNRRVLSSMEQGFINSDGDLACKLMAALQGAKTVGADVRCTTNGTSSLVAYVKVAKKSDLFGTPFLKIAVKTAANAGIEPIDSLQIKFNLKHNCSASNKRYSLNKHNSYQVLQNPITDEITITAEKPVDKFNQLQIRKITGEFIYESRFKQKISIPNSILSKGLYIVKIIKENQLFITKVIKN